MGFGIKLITGLHGADEFVDPGSFVKADETYVVTNKEGALYKHSILR